MTPTIPDLWPDSFVTPPQLTPVAILKQQGLLLGQKTGNLVYGEVQSKAVPSGEFMHVFYITAPLLAFRQPIAVVLHKVDHYPLRVGRVKPSGTVNQFGVPDTDGEYEQLTTPDEFLAVLKSILQAEGTKKLVGSLLAQSVEPTTPEHS